MVQGEKDSGRQMKDYMPVTSVTKAFRRAALCCDINMNTQVLTPQLYDVALWIYVLSRKVDPIVQYIKVFIN